MTSPSIAASARAIGALLLAALVCESAFAADSAKPAVQGWLNWRGPHQNGTSDEKNLPTDIAPGSPTQLWTYELAGRSTPVIAGDRVYAWGYRGAGADLQEVLVCLDAANGQRIWEHGFNDFLSDIVYERYSIGSPTVDPATGNVFVLSSPGIFASFAPDGKLLWQHSMMEQFGRLTFPNGRTGSPVIDDDLVIVRGITSNWGAQGPGRDRLYAFDKKTGEPVWASTPGTAPLDSAWGTPSLGWENGQRVLYVGTGCGHVAAVNARTGEPLWRYATCKGGVNVSLVLHDDKVISLHNLENIDTSETGRMIAIRVGAQPKAGTEGPVELTAESEAWRNPLAAFSSSPVLVGDRIYQTTQVGELACIDATNGKILWTKKLGHEQLHASPLYADGRLYVPLINGKFFVIKPSDDGAEIVSESQLDGNCLGAPAVWNGRLYVQTTEKLYCFGKKEGPVAAAAPSDEKRPSPGKPMALQIIPSEVLLFPGGKASFRVQSLDEKGFTVAPVEAATWTKFIPPTAAVRAEMDAGFDDSGNLVAAPEAKLSAGAFMASKDGLKGTLRGRLMPAFPYQEDFESFTLSEQSTTEPGLTFAHPPLPWIGGRFKWEVHDLDGNKVLAKTLLPTLFQRAFTFIGSAEMKNYTIAADVMSDGNRRTVSNVGLINQRYQVTLVGNAQQLEVSSNYDRIKQEVPFKWQPKTWYRLKTRVDVAEDGSGVVRAKAWPREEEEPSTWTIEVPHARAHKNGSPGLFGFALQSRVRVYIDNISVTAND